MPFLTDTTCLNARKDLIKKICAGKFLRDKIERTPNRAELNVWIGYVDYFGLFEEPDWKELLDACWQDALDDRRFVRCSFCNKLILPTEVWCETESGEILCSIWCDNQLGIAHRMGY